MAIDKIFNDANVDGIADNIFNSVSNSVSEVKAMQQRKAAENVQLVVESLKKIDTDIRAKFDNVSNVLEKRVSTIQDGRDGTNGSDGRDGKDGRNGKDGLNGKQGLAGMPGKDGVDGEDGVSVVDAHIDFDGSLIIDLSTGRAINVGEVVSQDLEERIRIVTSGGAGSGGGGSGTVTSVAVSGGTTGLTTSGGPITSSGTVTLAGTLAVANGGTGTTTPSIVAGTNITVSGSWPNQTIAASGSSGSVTSVAATVPAFLSVAGSPITTSGTLAISLSGTALPVANGGTGVTTSTGSGNVVLSTSPVLTTPNIGIPSAGVATNLTGLPLSTGVTGTLPVANGGSGTATPAIVAGTNVTVSGSWPNQTINASGDLVGPASATDNAITRFDAATGKLVQNSLVTIADDGAITAPQVGSVIPFYYANQAAFPSAATYHGALAHSHADGAMFFAHGGVWVRILDNGGPLGTPSSGTLTNATGLPLTTGVTGTLPIANGGTGASTLAGASIATYTGTETLTNKTLTSPVITNELVTTIRETITISATAATGTINFDASTQVVLYYTTNASGNFTVNFRGTSGISLNTLMSTGQSLSATFLVTNGATAYYNSVVQVDGSTVTPKWQGGTAPTSGNASSIDSYTYVIIKTGSAAFTVLASVTKFA